jgi:GntR family transcriptional regulator, rspAB operon transcriptional repressor
MSTRIVGMTAGASKRPRKSPANPLGKNLGRTHPGSTESKVDQIYGALKLAIVAGDLPPEAPIDKIDLCARFGVSRLSVTTAVNRLAFERLVVVEPQRGSYVSRIRISDVRQWMMIRRALEVEVVGACARQLGDDWIERLDRNMAYQRTAVKSGDLDGFHQLDIAFHRLLIEGLALDRVGEILESVRTHVDRTRRLLLPEPGRMPATLKEHQAIYRTIADRDPSAAARAMHTHLGRVLRELEAFQERHPNFFTD